MPTYATETRVGRDELLDFVRPRHHLILSTRRADGTEQLSPVDVTVNAAGQVVLSSRQTAMKVKNLRREPYASVCVFTDGFYGPWCQIEGPAHIVELPEAMEPLVDYYRRAAGKEHPDWDEYREAMVREQRVLVVIDVERTGPSVAG
jgi:PPOX class probable F420-dependent enzyme